MSALDECLKFTLREEGGYVNDSRDPGGATNMGITLATYRAWCNDPQADAAELRSLSPSTVTCIYGSDYWNRLRGSALPAGLNLLVFDFAVTCGTVRSARELQAALGLPTPEIDGSIGPETLLKARLAHGTDLIARLAKRQVMFYQVLPAYPVFGNGWLARTERRRVKAVAMANAASVVSVSYLGKSTAGAPATPTANTSGRWIVAIAVKWPPNDQPVTSMRDVSISG